MGCGVAPMYAHRAAFSIKDVGDLNGDLDLQTNFGPGINSGFKVIREGTTIQGFRITRDGSANTTYEYHPDVSAVLPAGVAGDYNGNGTVDAADYTLYRDNFGVDSSVLQNSNIPGIIGVDHYFEWKTTLATRLVA